ncbi:MAG: 50S ribosome-binding GTPase [Synergistetes bacterium]|nr:MAG: Ribosome biogenesis GTPase YqeH [bacterium 42_11]MBC7332104.1 50S ribosome-binding GTPase [Synergistota bacterium]MDK2871849.1 ribosome assembly GTPase [bacterium]
MKRCRGCGVPLQSDDPKRPGYIPPEKLDDPRGLCQRCFKIKYYGEFRSVPVEDFPFDEIAKNVDLICLIVDGVDIEGSWVLDRFREAKNIWVVVNKTDLLPFSKEEIVKWLREEKGWSGKVFLTSSKKGWGLKGFWEELNFVYRGKKVAFMGVTNVGKSSLVGRLLGDESITVSPWPGTTIDVVERKNEEGTIFIDTPGLVPSGRLYDLLCPDCQKKVIPSKKLSGKIFFLKSGKSLSLGGLSALTVLTGGLLLKPFVSYEVPLHRTNQKRLKEVIKEGAGEWLKPPCKGCFDRIEEIGWSEEVLEVSEGLDLAISGLGWVSLFKGEGKISLLLPSKVSFNLRRSIRG